MMPTSTLTSSIASLGSATSKRTGTRLCRRKLSACWLYKRPESRSRPGDPRARRSSSQIIRPQVSGIADVGKGSISLEILKARLASGAHVVITTSLYSPVIIEYYPGVFQRYGNQDSALIVVSCNQGSEQDVEAPFSHIRSILGLDYNCIGPLRRRARECP